MDKSHSSNNRNWVTGIVVVVALFVLPFDIGPAGQDRRILDLGHH